MARSVSPASTLSCIEVETSSVTLSAEPQSTPPTSVTDAASVSSGGTGKSAALSNGNGRVQRARSSISSYNENILSGKRRASHVKTAANDKPIGPSNTSGSRLQNLQLHAVYSGQETAPDDREIEPKFGSEDSPESTAKVRKTTRFNIPKDILATTQKIRAATGSRNSKFVKSGRGKARRTGLRTSLRMRQAVEAKSEGPVKKKTRLAQSQETASALSEIQLQPKAMYKPKVKRWLGQGLYVGQERNFDPRLTETKNKLKKQSAEHQAACQNKTLPLPMFAGQRLLEQGRPFKLPFDIFSPLPPGQPKPEEWRKTHKNVFVGDAADIWKKSKKLEHSTCICESESGCDEDCFNRFMLYECDNSNCNIGSEHCTNRSFEALRQRCKAGGKYNVGVEVIKTIDRGYGVRSNRTFEPNQIILEYTGETITQDECDERMKTRYKDNECFYLMVFDQNMIIDATRGSIARFVNHSCEPNCKMVKWTVAGKPRMALFAGDKGIMTGNELTYDYNFDPFSAKNIQECRCGTPSCRGVLGPKAKDREPKQPLKPLLNVGSKRKLQEDGNSCIAVTKKRKTSDPRSIKPARPSARSQANQETTKARTTSSSARRREELIKKLSKRTNQGTRRGPKALKLHVGITKTARGKPKVALLQLGVKLTDKTGNKSSRTTKSTNRRNGVKVEAKTLRVTVLKKDRSVSDMATSRRRSLR